MRLLPVGLSGRFLVNGTATLPGTGAPSKTRALLIGGDEFPAGYSSAGANKVGTRFVSYRRSIARPTHASVYTSPYASRRTTQDSRSE